MRSVSSLWSRFVDILTILVLGVIYVAALAVGTIVSFGYQKLKQLKSTGAGFLR